jgi:N-acetyl-gamma-glutamylphosphate reductase
MKIKVNDTWYDSKKTSIMVMFENNEKELIASMDTVDVKFCCFPDGMSEDTVKKFMEIK